MKLTDEETRNLVGLPVKAGSSLSEQILIQTLSEKHSSSPPKKQNGKFIVTNYSSTVGYNCPCYIPKKSQEQYETIIYNFSQYESY